MGQRTGRRYKAVSLARHLSLSLRLARSLIPTPSFASLLASLSLPRPAACTHEALAQATVTAPYIFPDSSGGGGSRVTIDIYKGGSSRCAFSPTLSLSTRGNIRFLRYERERERRKGGKIVRPLVPATVFTSYCSLPDSTGIVPLLSFFPSFLPFSLPILLKYIQGVSG